MMQAWAAETAAGHAGHAEPFYATAEFWVFVAFVILVGAGCRRVYKMAVEALDKRAEAIANQIEEATRLREEAQELLASYERKQRDAVSEAGRIAERARREADRMRDEAVAELEKSLQRQEIMARERIAHAEAAAIEEVRATAVEAAIAATRRLLAETLTKAKADALIDKAVKELPDKLH